MGAFLRGDAAYPPRDDPGATTTAHALACALLTDVRLPGVVVPCVTVALAVADSALDWYRGVPGRRGKILVVEKLQ